MSEDPTEQSQEDIHHHATHGGGEHGEQGGKASRWITAAALTAALLAALAAVAGGKEGSHLTEATHNRIDASDRWAQYQSKSIKNYSLASELEILKALKTEPPADITEKMASNENDKEEIKIEATHLNALSDAHLHTHETFEHATMMFHISIAIVAIAVVAKRKEFWFISILGGVIGIYFFGTAYLHSPPPEPPETPAAQHAPPEPH